MLPTDPEALVRCPRHPKEAAPLFKSHPITIVSSIPLGEVIQSHKATRRIAKWAVELRGEGITYFPRKAIKYQVLADFVAKWTETQTLPAPVEQEYWMMYFDGSLMKSGARARFVFISPLSVRMRYMIRIHFLTSNSVAEYEALVNGLHIASELGIQWLNV
jgi:hypothetical protein